MTILRRSFAGAVALGAMSVVPLVGAGAATTTSTSTTTTVPAPPAPAIYTKSIADALQATSFREFATVTSSGYLSTGMEDARATGGIETEKVVSASTQFSFSARLVSGSLFLNGDQLTLENVIGLSAFDSGFDAGHWLEIAKNAKTYGELTYGLDRRTAIEQISLGSKMTVSGPKKYEGKNVMAISSSLGLHASPTGSTQAGTFVLYVSTGATPLPVAEVIDDKDGKVAQHVTIAFSRWNERLTLSAPRPVTHVS